MADVAVLYLNVFGGKYISAVGWLLVGENHTGDSDEVSCNS